MKKLLIVLMVFMVSIFATSCKNNNDNNEPIPNPEPQVEPKPYIDGKKLVLLGDSISALGTWGKDTAQELNMHFYNAAMGGITSKEGIARFHVFVKDSNADFVTICFGQNDLIMNTYNTPKVSLNEFKENLIEMVNLVRGINAKPILLTTNPLNPDLFYQAQGQKRENYAEVNYDPLSWLDCYNAVTREVASLTECDLVDMRNEFSEKYYRSYLSDGIHLNSKGNQKFKTALVNYFLESYDKNPDAKPVKDEVTYQVVTKDQKIDIASKIALNWYANDSDAIKIVEIDNGLKFYNTNGLWPEATYTPKSPILVFYQTGYLYFDIKLENVNASIILFINGSTPAAYQNNEYIVLNSYFTTQVDNVSGDIIGPIELKGKIKLTDLNISNTCINEGNLMISGLKVFVAGNKNQNVIIKDLYVMIEE